MESALVLEEPQVQYVNQEKTLDLNIKKVSLAVAEAKLNPNNTFSEDDIKARGELAISAVKAMHACEFKPKYIPGKITEWLDNPQRDKIELKLKLASMNLLQNIWSKADNDTKKYIKATADFSTLPYQKLEDVEGVWKTMRDSRAKISESNTKDYVDPDYIATLVFFAFPEVNKPSMQHKYMSSLTELKTQLGEEGVVVSTPEYLRKIWEKASYIFPDDTRIRKGLWSVG